MGEAVGVDAGQGLGLGPGAGLGGDDLGIREVRCGGDRGGELGGELAEDEVLAALLDEPERRRVPERGGAAVAEQHLVAVGQVEQLGQPVAQRGDHEARRGLAVARAQVVAAVGGQRGDGLGPNLRRT